MEEIAVFFFKLFVCILLWKILPPLPPKKKRLEHIKKKTPRKMHVMCRHVLFVRFSLSLSVCVCLNKVLDKSHEDPNHRCWTLKCRDDTDWSEM